MDFRPNGNQWGTHRVIEPVGSLPQSALRLDASTPIYDNEILVDLQTLQIDSASFRLLIDSPRNQEIRGNNISEKIQYLVEKRGKLHNPITNSGGIFLGKVATMGPKHPLKDQLKVSDAVASLVSLTLTPLFIRNVISVDATRERALVKGYAIVFASGSLIKMPPDLPKGVVLAALDVCGAPAQVARLVRSGQTILILGLGKAGRAAALQASLVGARVMGVDNDAANVAWCSQYVPGHYQECDATNPLAVCDWVGQETEGEWVDMAIQATNVANTEMSTILPCKSGGKALFFGMNTSFQRATLGAEGVGKDVTLLMGSGFVPGHAELMLNLLRQNESLKRWFEEKYG